MRPESIILRSDYNYTFDFVKVNVTATYDGFFRPLDGLEISVTATGPYL